MVPSPGSTGTVVPGHRHHERSRMGLNGRVHAAQACWRDPRQLAGCRRFADVQRLARRGLHPWVTAAAPVLDPDSAHLGQRTADTWNHVVARACRLWRTWGTWLSMPPRTARSRPGGLGLGQFDGFVGGLAKCVVHRAV